MDDEDLGEPVNGHLFVEIVHLLALRALVAALLHLLRRDEVAKAVVQVYIPSDPHSLPWNRYAKVHEVVKGIRRVLAMLTLNLVHQLACKQIGYNGIISRYIVVPPVLTLLIDRQLVKVHFLVSRFLLHPV